jgi:hypothetical protein
LEIKKGQSILILSAVTYNSRKFAGKTAKVTDVGSNNGRQFLYFKITDKGYHGIGGCIWASECRRLPNFVYKAAGSLP